MKAPAPPGSKGDSSAISWAVGDSHRPSDSLHLPLAFGISCPRPRPTCFNFRSRKLAAPGWAPGLALRKLKPSVPALPPGCRSRDAAARLLGPALLAPSLPKPMSVGPMPAPSPPGPRTRPSLGDAPSPAADSPQPQRPSLLGLEAAHLAASAMSPVPPREGDPGARAPWARRMASPPTATVTSSVPRHRRHLCCRQRRGVRKRKMAEAFPAWRVGRETWERLGREA